MKKNCSPRDSQPGITWPLVSAAGLLLSLLLSGCVSQSSVKNFNGDREKFLMESFDASKLSGGIRSPIEAAFVESKKYNKVVMQYDVTQTNNGVVKYLTSTVTDYGRDHGLDLYQVEFAANGIPYRVNNGIGSPSMMGLDYQAVFWTRTIMSVRRWITWSKKLIPSNLPRLPLKTGQPSPSNIGPGRANSL